MVEERLGDYRELWASLASASPMRLDDPVREGHREPLNPVEAALLDHSLSLWYYRHGHGMTLTRDGQAMYSRVRRHLREFARSTAAGRSALQQKRSRETVLGRRLTWGRRRAQALEQQAFDRAKGERLIRELSLLRTQMKLDVDVYRLTPLPDSRERDLDDLDKEFLRECGINPQEWLRHNRRRRFAGKFL